MAYAQKIPKAKEKKKFAIEKGKYYQLEGRLPYTFMFIKNEAKVKRIDKLGERVYFEKADGIGEEDYTFEQLRALNPKKIKNPKKKIII